MLIITDICLSGKGKLLGQKTVKFTILFDRRAVDPSLGTGWGFSCLVQSDKGTLLFDTGADDQALMNNFETLGLDPSDVRQIVISHAHGDHTGGLMAILSKAPGATVFLPEGVSEDLVRAIEEAGGKPVTVDNKFDLDDVFTVTGPLGGAIPEQVLAVNTPRGVVVLTGCAHNKIENMLPQVKDMTGAPKIHGVVGGLHLFGSGTARIRKVIECLQNHGVELLGPAHCTGNTAVVALSKALPDGFVPLGSGQIIEVSDPSQRN
jgi:7,8-dihydropterin-6-yl-methyl-4-(beta-D-ribofuranosyl)aminobenzene 5'-phosphate synthase